MEQMKVAGWSAEGLSVVSAAAALYRVDIGYGEMGYEENHPLGHWVGMAESAEQAEALAMDAIWDRRLDVVCSPRIQVRRVDQDEEVCEGLEGG